jgi:hypothetical protein
VKHLDEFNWSEIEAALDAEGQAVLSGLLSETECQALTVLDERDRGFGDAGSLDALLLGTADLRHFSKVPSLLGLRAGLYEKLVSIANRWNTTMDMEPRYPARLGGLLQMCHRANQHRPNSTVRRLREGGYLPLGQNAEGDCVFPLQAELQLTQSGKDFLGGEFVLTEQRPRMQTRPMVISLNRGDLLVFAVHYRPFQGTNGYYRVNLRHAVSRVRSGERIAVNLVFHDSP